MPLQKLAKPTCFASNKKLHNNGGIVKARLRLAAWMSKYIRTKLDMIIYACVHPYRMNQISEMTGAHGHSVPPVRIITALPNKTFS